MPSGSGSRDPSLNLSEGEKIYNISLLFHLRICIVVLVSICNVSNNRVSNKVAIFGVWDSLPTIDNIHVNTSDCYYVLVRLAVGYLNRSLPNPIPCVLAKMEVLAEDTKQPRFLPWEFDTIA